MHYRYRFFGVCIALASMLPISADAETVTVKSVVVPSDLTATLTGSLSFPSGTGPFPVVILLHPCGGLERFGLATLQTHAKSLQNGGFGTLILDSYGPRKLNGGKACDMRTTAWLRKADAFNAMVVLQSHAKVSKDNIFLLGLSDGAVGALVAAKGDAAARFNAVVAYYPGCQTLDGISITIQSPLLVFVAGRDDWTPPAKCMSAKTAGIVKGAEFDVINYPDAHHGFDQQRETIRYKGHTLAYNAEAASDSRKRVREFFTRHLTDELKAKAPFSSKTR
jgi:dienelactone hydrolase